MPNMGRFVGAVQYIYCCCSLLLSSPPSPVTALDIMSTRSAAALRVASYNLLSSHLSAPNYYTTLNPDHLDPAARLTKVLTKLEHELVSNKSRSTIFCLQEVSYEWAGALHTFFAKHSYHVITGLYGKKFNGYMGVLTAYPTDSLATVRVDIQRLADTTEWPKEPEEGTLRRLVKSIVSPPLKYLGWHKDEPESHWSIAQRRFNVLLTAVLRDKHSETEFCIGNYHMPCCYYSPMVMVMHSDLCLAHVQAVAAAAASDSSEKGVPYILAGDFNIKPSDPAYKLLTTGVLDAADPSYPTPPLFAPEHLWKPMSTTAVRSAYAAANDGCEPDFTNYSRVKEQEPFVDTLDYIFVSDSVSVENVLPIQHRDSVSGPFPNGDEPSDHVLIAANLYL